MIALIPRSLLSRRQPDGASYVHRRPLVFAAALARTVGAVATRGIRRCRRGAAIGKINVLVVANNAGPALAFRGIFEHG
jgi:hypothetical protein